ncbi:MAG: ankyrin repeat domain-containing protein, partial [Bryobacteraceae bacterium]
MKPIFEAIQSGDAAKVAALLDAEAGLVNERNEQGTSPFAFSIYTRQTAIAMLLEERGAEIDVFAASMIGRTALVASLVDANKSLVTLLSKDGWTALHLAAFFGHLDAARELLNKGAVVNARSTNAMKNTPLHAAAAGRSLPVVQLLIERGADVNARQHGGFTALHAAAQSGDVAMAAALADAGADLKLRADNNQSALDFALLKGHQAI